MTIRIYEVGGSIRDEVMGVPRKGKADRDFVAVCDGGWVEMRGWCHEHMDKVWLETPQYLTIRGRIGTQDIDLVLSRKDGEYADGRHPDSVEPGTLMDDRARRDFTVNAMAREVDTTTLEPIGEIIDPFGGRQDCEWRTLRCVGSTWDRFREDGLRILRALRFSITKGLLTDPEIRRVLEDTDYWPKLLSSTISRDRVREELQKIFAHDTKKAIQALARQCSREMLDAIFGDDIWLLPTTKER